MEQGPDQYLPQLENLSGRFALAGRYPALYPVANPTELKAINFDRAWLSLAATLAGCYLIHANGEKADSSGAKTLRARAFTHLKEAVDELRATGSYVFRKDPGKGVWQFVFQALKTPPERSYPSPERGKRAPGSLKHVPGRVVMVPGKVMTVPGRSDRAPGRNFIWLERDNTSLERILFGFGGLVIHLGCPVSPILGNYDQ